MHLTRGLTKIHLGVLQESAAVLMALKFDWPDERGKRVKNIRWFFNCAFTAEKIKVSSSIFAYVSSWNRLTLIFRLAPDGVHRAFFILMNIGHFAFFDLVYNGQFKSGEL